MIQEAYCSCVVSKLLKEKGFQEPCTGLNKLLCKEGEKPVLRITHQKAMRWLREVHKIFIYIEPFITTSGLQGYKPYCTKIGGEFMWTNPLRKYSNTSSDTYEEAVEVALKYCLENLI